MERLPAEPQAALKKHSTDHAGRPNENVNKLEMPQLLEAVAELQFKQSGAAMANPSGAEGNAS